MFTKPLFQFQVKKIHWRNNKPNTMTHYQPEIVRSFINCVKHMNLSVKTVCTAAVISYTRSLSWTCSAWIGHSMFALLGADPSLIPSPPSTLQTHDVRIEACNRLNVVCFITSEICSWEFNARLGSAQLPKLQNQVELDWFCLWMQKSCLATSFHMCWPPPIPTGPHH